MSERLVPRRSSIISICTFVVIIKNLLAETRFQKRVISGEWNFTFICFTYIEITDILSINFTDMLSVWLFVHILYIIQFSNITWFQSRFGKHLPFILMTHGHNVSKPNQTQWTKEISRFLKRVSASKKLNLI